MCIRDRLLTHINKIHKNITFTAEYEHNNTINFLDLSIKKLEHRHKFSIYRKPTTKMCIRDSYCTVSSISLSLFIGQYTHFEKGIFTSFSASLTLSVFDSFM